MRQNGIRRVTLQDIANETGYSVNTVSHALRGMSDIADDTAERIREVARAMGYAPNQLASSLRSGRTRTLALIIGNMSNPFYGIMADTIQDAAAARNYSLLIMCSREQAQLELNLVETALAHRVDGILLFPTNESLPTIERLITLKIPFVLMSRALDSVGSDCVISDEVLGAKLATQHLIDQGRRKLGYFAHQRIVYCYERRLAGFIQACDEAGIPEADRRCFVYSEEGSGRRLGDDWIATTGRLLTRWREEGVDGIFVFCDDEAWHVQSTIQQTPELQGWNVGIVGFDNIQGTQHFPFNLCSVDCGFQEMARQGVELIRARIHGDARPPQTVINPVRLVCRGSCGSREE